MWATWEEAQTVMGDTQAAIVLACLLRRSSAIQSAGGYLRELTRKARAGEFSLAEVAPWERMRQQGGMKASTAWSPAAGLNVVSVERGDQAWTVTGRRWAASCLSEVWRAVQIAPQHLLTNASGSVRSRSASHCSSPPRALEVSQPEV
jgi:hypothetical protein